MKRIPLLLAVSICACSLSAQSNGSLDSVRRAFVEASVADFSPSEVVTERFVRYSDFGRANDVLPMQLYMSVHLPDKEVERLVALFDSDHWSDIDYTDRTNGRWNPTLHLTRLYSITKLYADPSSHWYKSGRLHDLIHSAVRYWYESKPVSPNWWHNQIGAPKKLAAVMLMIYDELSPDELQGGLSILERSQFGRTGQNKVWLAGNNLMKGLITNDTSLVVKARDTMAEEITTTTLEGVQPDWSFHQHGPQIQFGNYGLAFAEGLAFWFRVLDSTPYAFSAEQYLTVANLLREGICWSVWRGIMDPNFCGRQIFIDGGRGKAVSLAVTARNMSFVDTAHSESFGQTADRNLQPERYANTLCGARYFYRSDCGIYRSRQWYASNRMHSVRTIGFEMTNNENTLANFSADGALLFMQHGGEYENIFACWDWLRVPGTTTFSDGRPIKSSDKPQDKLNNSDWVGGVADSLTMATVMTIERDGLHALKANFFFFDVVVALGCDVRCSNSDCIELSTSVDQNRLDGKVSYGIGNGGTKTIDWDESKCLSFDNLSWVNHDNRGYVLLGKPQKSVLSTCMQRGVWDRIDLFYHNAVDSARIFKLYLSHRPSGVGSYAYAFLPCSTPRQTARFARSGSVVVLRNDDACQAVEHNGSVAAIFHKAGAVASADAQLRIGVDQPALVIVRNGLVSISSPRGGCVNVVVEKGGVSESLQFALPDDEASAGKTLSATF